MKLADLPEDIQLKILEKNDAWMRAHNTTDVHLLKHLDECIVFGMELEATRHNSRVENLWQSLNAFKIAVMKAPGGFAINPSLIDLVDQCLIENKPQTLVP